MLFRVLFVTLSLGLVCACDGASDPAALASFSLEQCRRTADFKDRAAYTAAVEDASQRSLPPAQLEPIIASNPDLVWDGAPGESRVLVTTWIKHSYYDAKLGQDNQTLGGETWVTPARLFQRCCQAAAAANGASKAAVVRRMEQVLGLPDNYGRLRVAEIWARPADLFRPCADPEVTTDACLSRTAPSGTSATHTEWFESWQDQAYTVSATQSGYPFTGVGYSYDWGDEGKVGPTEYVLPKTAVVKIEALTATETYCGATAE